MDGEPLPGRCRVEAWSPGVPGIREVFHARLVDYSYPPHCHDTWAVLIVDDGAIQYRLDRRESQAAGQAVVLLPPGVAHDGRPAPGVPGFRKRELYLDETFFPCGLTGAAPAEVAAMVGFCDQAHFTRNFKKHTSATPASYARSHMWRSPGTGLPAGRLSPGSTAI